MLNRNNLVRPSLLDAANGAANRQYNNTTTANYQQRTITLTMTELHEMTSEMTEN